MAVMRAQVSLMFDDADLFENFITPCKEERRLNGIIIKCLKAYYFDERVRSMIEGGPADDEDVPDVVQSTQSLCDSIRASLIMQDFLVEELKQTVDAGMDDVESILSKANQKAESHGFGSSYQTKSGSTILQLEAPKQQAPAEAPSAPANVEATAPDGIAAVLLQAVLMLAKDANNSQVTALLQQAGLGQQQVAPTVSTETSRQPTTSQVAMPKPSVGADFVGETTVVDLGDDDDFGGEPTVTVQPVQPPVQPIAPPVQAPVAPPQEDASDALSDLMSSL